MPFIGVEGFALFNAQVFEHGNKKTVPFFYRVVIDKKIIAKLRDEVYSEIYNTRKREIDEQIKDELQAVAEAGFRKELFQDAYYEIKSEIEEEQYEDICEEVKTDVRNEIYEEIKSDVKEEYDDIYKELKSDVFDDKHKGIKGKIRKLIVDGVKSEIYEESYQEIKDKIYLEEINNAKEKALREYSSQKRNYDGVLSRLAETYESDIDFEVVADELVESLRNYEWENLDNPLEILLIDGLRNNSVYMAEIEEEVKENLKHELLLTFVKKDPDIMNKLKKEFEEEFLQSMDASIL